jgi:hypothetical protein
MNIMSILTATLLHDLMEKWLEIAIIEAGRKVL